MYCALSKHVQATTRMSQTRSDVRSIAISKVPVHYGLHADSPNQKPRIAALLKGKRYIFPGDIMVRVYYSYQMLLNSLW